LPEQSAAETPSPKYRRKETPQVGQLDQLIEFVPAARFRVIRHWNCYLELGTHIEIGRSFKPLIRSFNCPVQPSLTARANSIVMPEKKTIERARQDEAEGKAPSTQAGEFVREEKLNLFAKASTARAPPDKRSLSDSLKRGVPG